MFWSKLIGSGDDWDITPTQNIYQNLVRFGTNLDLIKNLLYDHTLTYLLHKTGTKHASGLHLNDSCVF